MTLRYLTAWIPKAAANEAAFIAEQKKDLSRRFALLSAKKLELDDAERTFRELRR